MLKVVARHLASTLTNTDDEAEDLAVYRQAYIVGSGSPLLISCPGFKVVQPCRVLRSQGYPPSPQSFQNRSRRDHRQVRSSRVTRQDLQSSSHNPGVTMTCWCQPFVIKPDDIPKVLLCHLASKP